METVSTNRFALGLPSRRTTLRATTFLAVALVGVIVYLGVGATFDPSMLAFPAIHWGPAGPTTPAPGAPPNRTGPNGDVCNSVGSPTPSALLIPTVGPAGSLASGGRVSVVVELAALNSSTSTVGLQVEIPSLFANFPLTSGGFYSVYFPPSTTPVPGSNWVDPAWATATSTTAWALSFANLPAVLTSEKIAVQANTSYGSLTLEFRWHWSIVDGHGSTTTGLWSVPTDQSGWPSSVPSIFFPAPFIGLQRSSSSTVVIGNEYPVELTGAATGRWFYLELEEPVGGQVFQNAPGSPAGASSTIYRVAIMILNYDGYLFPGPYLVHVHDDCGALLYSISVQAVYPTTASVEFVVHPSSCGSVDFNGTAQANGTTAEVPPSSTPFPFSIPGCGSHSFVGWSTTGAVHIQSSHELLVSANGSLTVNYS